MRTDTISIETEEVVLFRRSLLFILAAGLVVTFVELLLLKHTDGVWQLAPLALLAASALVLIWYGALKSRAALQLHRVIMLIFLLSGIVGTVMHFVGNVTYERESNPSLSGWELYQSAVKGSTPSLAPGAMIMLGLIGLLWTFRHPALADRKVAQI